MKLKGFGCFPETTKEQQEFAGKLGLDVKGIPQNVAKAMVFHLIITGFDGEKIKSASKKQIELGKKFDWDFSCMPSAIAYAYIKNILWELNFAIIKQQQLEPGVWTVNIHNGEKRQILNIDKKGVVSFSDSDPHKRYARALLRCDAPPDNKPVFDQVSPPPEALPVTNMTHEQLLSILYNHILRATEPEK
jgi:hypothetical protein